MRFENREEAGRRLAEALSPYVGEAVLVAAIPRGGVVVGYQVARALGAPLDVVVARKVGAPSNPEFAIGAVAPGGVRVLDEAALQYLDINPEELAALEARARAEMERQIQRFRGGDPLPQLEGRTVIVVDDGLATGLTARAAVLAIRGGGPARLVLAVPVGPPDLVERLRQEVDDLVCLVTPEPPFIAVGQWYEDFGSVEDTEVLALLEGAREWRDSIRSPAKAG